MTATVRSVTGAALAALLALAAAPVSAQFDAGAPTGKAETLVGEMARGNYYGASRQFVGPGAAGMTPDHLETVWGDLAARYGDLLGYEAKAVDAEGTRYRVHVLCEFERGFVDARITFETLDERGPVSLELLPVAGPEGPFPAR